MSKFSSRFVKQGIGMCLALALVVLMSGNAQAQIDPDAKYKFIPIPAKFEIRMPEGLTKEDKEAYRKALDARTAAQKERNKSNSLVTGILKGGAIGANEDLFNEWFNWVLFAEMTQTDEESLLELPKRRQNFFLRYVEAKEMTPPVHDHLIKLTKSTMLNIAKGDFHPAVRYNAMLIVGKLNSTEAISIGSNKSPPIPWFDALRDLFTEYKNAAQIEPVKIAAMLGILRHVKLDGQRRADLRMPFEARAAVIAEMTALLSAADPPGTRTPEGHRWMQRRAIDILGGLRDLGPDNVVAKKLSAIINDTAEPISYRCSAAAVYGQLNFPPPPNPAAPDPSVAVRQIAALASQACRQELKRIEELEEELQERELRVKLNEARGASTRNVSRNTSVKFQDYQVDASRRFFKYYINCCQTGIGLTERDGFRKYSTKDPHKSKVKDFVDALKDVMSATDKRKDDPEFTMDLLVDAVEENLRPLDKLVGVATPKAAEPGEALPVGPGPDEAGPGPVDPLGDGPGPSGEGPGPAKKGPGPDVESPKVDPFG